MGAGEFSLCVSNYENANDFMGQAEKSDSD